MQIQLVCNDIYYRSSILTPLLWSPQNIMFIIHTHRCNSILKWEWQFSCLPLAPLAPVLWGPFDTLGVDPDLSLSHGVGVTLQYLRCQTDDVLPLVVLHQVEILQCGDNILLAYARPFTYLAAQFNNMYKTMLQLHECTFLMSEQKLLLGPA